jgi:hypothetical protein
VAVGTAIVLPFEMDTIVLLSRNRLVATHYGLYNTVCGIGILAGNAGTGWAIDLARSAGVPPAPWAVLIAIGLLCGAALLSLCRRGLLDVPEESSAAPNGMGGEDRPTVVLQDRNHDLDGPTQPLPRIRPAQPATSPETEPATGGTRPLQRVGGRHERGRR